MKNKINSVLFKTMFVLIPITLFTLAYSYSVHALADKIYEYTAKPFLAQTVIATHKAITINKSQIEYSVLKVPAAKTTGVKK